MRFFRDCTGYTTVRFCNYGVLITRGPWQSDWFSEDDAGHRVESCAVVEHAVTFNSYLAHSYAVSWSAQSDHAYFCGT